jgi:hypothetical protein
MLGKGSLISMGAMVMGLAICIQLLRHWRKLQLLSPATIRQIDPHTPSGNIASANPGKCCRVVESHRCCSKPYTL